MDKGSAAIIAGIIKHKKLDSDILRYGVNVASDYFHGRSLFKA